MDKLEKLGSGGFANVFRKGDKAFKYLKDDVRVYDGAYHRFKREFQITKELSFIDGIIPVYDYVENDNDIFYTMDLCDYDLYYMICSHELTLEQKILYIDMILNIMVEVHNADHIHRDLSPKNILLKDGKILISDFGLGKNIHGDYTYQTQNTQHFGQYYYVSPEQFNLLENATKQSDVYSLGKIINFILTKDPNADNHILMTACQKSTAQNPAYRYEDAQELQQDINNILTKRKQKDFAERCLKKIAMQNIDSSVSEYLISLSHLEHYANVQNVNLYINAIVNEITKNTSSSLSLLESIHKSMDHCSDFESYDPYSAIAYSILNNSQDNISYDIKMTAVEIINYVAYRINRFDAQDKIKSLLSNQYLDNNIISALAK